MAPPGHYHVTWGVAIGRDGIAVFDRLACERLVREGLTSHRGIQLASAVPGNEDPDSRRNPWARMNSTGTVVQNGMAYCDVYFHAPQGFDTLEVHRRAAVAFKAAFGPMGTGWSAHGIADAFNSLIPRAPSGSTIAGPAFSRTAIGACTSLIRPYNPSAGLPPPPSLSITETAADRAQPPSATVTAIRQSLADVANKVIGGLGNLESPFELSVTTKAFIGAGLLIGGIAVVGYTVRGISQAVK